MAQQLEVVFSRPLRDVELVDPATPLPPSPPRSAARGERGGDSAPAVAPSSLLPPAAPQTTLWETEIGQQLAEDKTTISTTMARLEDAIRALQEQRGQRIIEWQHAAIELGVVIAARLLHERIEAGGMALETVARAAVARLEPDEPVTIRFNPLDLAVLEKRLDGAPLLPSNLPVQILGDATLGRGDCHVVGREGSVLSEVRAQLAALRSDLLEKSGDAGPQSS